MLTMLFQERPLNGGVMSLRILLKFVLACAVSALLSSSGTANADSRDSGHHPRQPAVSLAQATKDKQAVDAAHKPKPFSKYHKGLLWKIEAGGLQPSYLFGTIHSDDPRVTKLPKAVEQAFDRSGSFTMELIADGAGIVAMAEAMFFNDGRTLESVLGKALYAETRAALSEQGLPTRGIEKKKPWAIIMALSTPRPKSGLFLDLALQVKATLQAKPTYGLESMQEQIAVFNDMPMPDQVKLLKETLRIHRQIKEQLEELIQAYLARDLAHLMTIVHKFKPDDDRVYRAMIDRLLTKRNKIMAERMKTRLQEGNAFIAIGAGHLPGKQGVLHLLELSGYRVTAVY